MISAGRSTHSFASDSSRVQRYRCGEIGEDGNGAVSDVCAERAEVGACDQEARKKERKGEAIELYRANHRCTER